MKTLPHCARDRSSASGAAEHGFTLVEVMVAATILVVGVLALLTLLDTANAGSATVRVRDGGTNVARQMVEAARSIPYSSLTPNTIQSNLQTQPGLENDGQSGGWTVTRRGATYSLAASVCTVDDPADGMGPHDPGVFCADTGSAGTSDDNADDYKRVTVDVSWAIHNVTRHVHQVTVVNNPGSAGGPAVTGLSIALPATSLVTSLLSGVTFTATTSVSAASVAFSVDGVSTSTAVGNSLLWTYLWPITSLVDGTHLVTAQAFDTAGLSGATRSVTIKLNRFLPTAPVGLIGGRNGSVVDLEWLSNPERDIAGYKAYRGLPGLGATLVCPLTRNTDCQDPAPPAGIQTYFVVADDLDAAGAYRDGTASVPITVLTTNHAPNPPTVLAATQSGGATTLTWHAPAIADIDLGDGISFYRIYRDGTAIADRYDRTGAGTDLSYVDGRTDGTSHQYWVTSVDHQLTESTMLGPVTL